METTKNVDDLLGYKPGWIIRNGNLLFLAFAALLLYGSGFIWYRERINVPASLRLASHASNDNELIMTVPYSATEKIHTGDKIEIFVKKTLSDSLLIHGEAAPDINTSTRPKKDSSIRIKVFDRSLVSTVFRQQEAVMANATILLPPERLSHRLWESVSQSFVLVHKEE